MVFYSVYRPPQKGGRFLGQHSMLPVTKSMEYPEQDRVGRVVDQGLQLLKKTRRHHRAAKAIANR